MAVFSLSLEGLAFSCCSMCVSLYQRYGFHCLLCSYTESLSTCGTSSDRCQRLRVYRVAKQRLRSVFVCVLISPLLDF